MQAEIVERVEQAGGSVLALDIGAVTNGSAAQWLSGTMLGAVSEYHRRTTAERTADAVADAVARGVLPAATPPGYLRGEDGRLKPDETAPAVAEAFEMRADGATIAEIRAHLQGAGVKRSVHGVETLLASRVYLGEIHYGKLTPNLHAHPAIVDRALWQRVQRVKVSGGRHGKSDRLLARLGVLHCGTCGSRMTVGSARSGKYALYKCGAPDCSERVTISAPMVEGVVLEHLRGALRNEVGMAAIEDNAAAAERALAAAEDALAAAIEGFMQAGVDAEPTAVKRMAELRATRDKAQAEVDHSLTAYRRPVLSVHAVRDWDRLTLDEQRALIRAVIESVTVAPAEGRRSTDRITVRLVGE